MGSKDQDERHSRIDILKEVRLAWILNECDEEENE